MLEKMLELAKNRKEQADAPPAVPEGGYSGPAFTIKTFNAISPVGLKKFEAGKYKVMTSRPLHVLMRLRAPLDQETAPGWSETCGPRAQTTHSSHC